MARLWKQKGSEMWYVDWKVKVGGKWVHRARSTKTKKRSEAEKIFEKWEKQGLLELESDSRDPFRSRLFRPRYTLDNIPKEFIPAIENLTGMQVVNFLRAAGVGVGQVFYPDELERMAAQATMAGGGDPLPITPVPVLPKPQFVLPLSDVLPWTEKNSRLKGSEKQARARSNFYMRFYRWIQDTHPDKIDVVDITQAIANEFMVSFSKSGHAPVTCNNFLSAMNVLWKGMQAPLNLPINPWSTVVRDNDGAIRYEPFTLDEVNALFSAADKLVFESVDPGFWRCAIEIAFFTGLRLGDIATLDYSEICVEEGILRLIPNKTKHWGKEQTVFHTLDGAPWVKRLPSLSGEGAVFPKANRLYDGSVLHTQFRRIMQKAGIVFERKPKEGERRINNVRTKCFHSLRHTYATFLMKAGATRQLLIEQGTWTTAQMAERYDHAKQEEGMRAARKIAEIQKRFLSELDL